MCDRYRSLAIGQHLIAFCSSLCASLHPKLNDIIYPLLSSLKSEPEVFFQSVIASQITDSLLPALKKAGKVKPMEGVINLLLKSMAKEEEFVESRGGLMVVREWVRKQ